MLPDCRLLLLNRLYSDLAPVHPLPGVSATLQPQHEQPSANQPHGFLFLLGHAPLERSPVDTRIYLCVQLNDHKGCAFCNLLRILYATPPITSLQQLDPQSGHIFARPPRIQFSVGAVQYMLMPKECTQLITIHNDLLFNSSVNLPSEKIGPQLLV